MRTIRESLVHRINLADGSVARSLRGADVDPTRDFFGQKDLYEALNLSRLDLVRSAHKAFLEAGADIIRTNTLRANPLSLAAHGMAEEAFILNYQAAQAAAEAVDSVPGRGRRRYVLGLVRDDGWDESPGAVEAAVDAQVQGLIAGGVDGVLLDVLPGVGRIQAMLSGARRARAALNSETAIFLQSIETGPHFGPRTLDASDGVVRYRPGEAKKSAWLDAAVADGRVNLIGGGATPADTKIIDRMLRERAEDNFRPVLGWLRDNAPIDDFQPASSWTRFPREIAKTSGSATLVEEEVKG